MFFQLVRKQIPEWLIMDLICSKWISIRMNPNQASNPNQSRTNPSSDWSKPNFQLEPIRMNPDQSKQSFFIRINQNISDVGFIRIGSKWKFGFDQSELGLVRIGSDSFRLKFILSKSEPLWAIPESVSEPIWKTFCTSFKKKRSKFNPT